MSRSQEEWDEQRDRAIGLRTNIYETMDLIDVIDSVRFSEIDDDLTKLEEHLTNAADVVNTIIGRLTRVL